MASLIPFPKIQILKTKLDKAETKEDLFNLLVEVKELYDKQPHDLQTNLTLIQIYIYLDDFKSARDIYQKCRKDNKIIDLNFYKIELMLLLIDGNLQGTYELINRYIEVFGKEKKAPFLADKMLTALNDANIENLVAAAKESEVPHEHLYKHLSKFVHPDIAFSIVKRIDHYKAGLQYIEEHNNFRDSIEKIKSTFNPSGIFPLLVKSFDDPEGTLVINILIPKISEDERKRIDEDILYNYLPEPKPDDIYFYSDVKVED